tara:strand:+ start:22 stop:168 length:147 start_codon:yes stop_codon:yes gene_type:complete
MKFMIDKAFWSIKRNIRIKIFVQKALHAYFTSQQHIYKQPKKNINKKE